MNEKLQYASMLEIPVNTCNITYKPAKKNRRKKAKLQTEEVKQELLTKVNTATENAEQPTAPENYSQNQQEENPVQPSFAVHTSTFKENAAETKKPFKFTAVTVELIIIGALLAVILLSTALMPNSGISTFMKGVFAPSSTAQTTPTVDERNYSEFAPVLALGNSETVEIKDGVMNITASGSVYAPCNGKVTAITADGNGKFSVEIEHSKNFKSTLSGLDYAYAETGDTVYGNIPVGYCGENGIKMCFTGADGAVITDYKVNGNSVVWAV